MRFVLDASVAASWCFADENDPVANAAADVLLNTGMALAPLLFWFEIRNVVLIGLRKGRTTDELLNTALDRIARSPISIEPLPQEEMIFVLAKRHRLTFYDAAYLELAIRARIALATLDQALARAATAEGVALIGA